MTNMINREPNTLYVMSGVPGSGKTTRATRMQTEDAKLGIDSVILSADNIREELYGDAAIQGDGNLVFQILEKRVMEALEAGKTVYYDTTNRTRRGRRQLTKKFRPFCKKIVCIYMNPPKAVAIAQNAQRTRVVPEDVMERYFDTSTIPSKDEGFDLVYIVC